MIKLTQASKTVHTKGRIMKATIKKNGKTYSFDIIRRSDLTKEERHSYISQGYDGIFGEDLEDEEFATIEKEAAKSVGINDGFMCKQIV